MKFLLPIFTTLLLAACGDNTSNAAQGSVGGDSAAPTAPLTAADRGRQAFGECGICHSAREGDPARVGPNLFGVFGRDAGSADGFSYSKAMRESGIIWTDETLDAFILNPQKSMSGNRMGYAGMSNTERRADLIAYLKTLQPVSD